MARSFNGTSDVISLGTPAGLDVVGNVTVSAWVKFAALPTGANIAQIYGNGYDGTNVGLYFDYFATGGVLRIGTFGGTGGGQVAYGITPTLATWYHFLGLYDSANWVLDVNGTQVASAAVASSGGQASTARCSIGALDLTGTFGRFINGTIAEVGVWNTSLSAGARKALAAGIPPPLAAPGNLKGYWPLLGDSPVPDYSGNRFSGTLTGTTVANHPGIRTLLWVPRSFTPDVAAAGTTTITVALAGSSSLTATATEYHRFTASLAGTSSLTATATELQRFTVSLAGTSSLTSTATELHRFTVALAGTSTLAATTTEYQRFTATLAGTSTLTAAFGGLRIVAATLAGTSALTTTVTPYQRFTTTLAGSSTLAATVVEYHRFTVAIAGTSALATTVTGGIAASTVKATATVSTSELTLTTVGAT